MPTNRAHLRVKIGRALSLACVSLASVMATASPAGAVPITFDVEFRWDVFGSDCETAGAQCTSLFTLTNLGDGTGLAPSLDGSTLSLNDGSAVTARSWDFTDPSFSSIPTGVGTGLPGFPISAATTVFATFNNVTLTASIGLSLVDGDLTTPTSPFPDLLLSGARLLTFTFDDGTDPDPDLTPIPEPSTLALLTIGLVAVGRRYRRR